MESKKYEGTGQCIVCLKSSAECDLTDEHIIPEALHGAVVFKNAVCRACAESGNRLHDSPALNSDLLLPRLLLGLKGKRNRPSTQDLRHLPAVYSYEGHPIKVKRRLTNFPIEMYPKQFVLLLFEEPGFLCGINRGGEIRRLRTKVFNLGGRQLTNVEVIQNRRNGPFARAIAKIGYFYAVAERGMTFFDGSAIREILRGERDDVYNFVGSSSQREILPRKYLHYMFLREIDGWLVAIVHLFASVGADTSGEIPYRVVVGRLR